MRQSGTKIIPVVGGRFDCDSCGRAFVGTYQGDPKEMRCPFCEGLIERDWPAASEDEGDA